MPRNSIDPSERFQLTRDEGELATQVVGTFGTFGEAEEYRNGLGDAVKHVRFNIVDRSKNIYVDAADDTELNELKRREELVARRNALIAAEEDAAKREAALKVGAPDSSSPVLAK